MTSTKVNAKKGRKNRPGGNGSAGSPIGTGSDGGNTILGMDMKSMMTNEDENDKIEMIERFDTEGRCVRVPRNQFLFSTDIKIIRPVITHHCEDRKDSFCSEIPQQSEAMLLGNMPLNKKFHAASNRSPRGSHDLGLDDADLTAADGIPRKHRVDKEKARENKSTMQDMLKTVKGDFVFPYRTYKPKVQVANRVPVGQVPQAVVVERLNRIYRKTDINLILQQFGIENEDLIPPVHYGENNERFYQESMFRCRTRINGIEKRDFISKRARLSSNLPGKGLEDEADDNGEGTEVQAQRKESISYFSGSNTEDSYEISKSSADFSSKESSIHPFIKHKPPFNPMLPLDFFDDEDFDIRSGEEWINLGWNAKEKVSNAIPGKAFLPFPTLPEERKAMTLSQITFDQLLKSTPRLEKFYQTLIRLRFDRMVRMAGLDPARIKAYPKEVELAHLARVGSTIPSLFHLDGKGSAKDTRKKDSERSTAVDLNSSKTSLQTDEEEGEAEEATGPINPEEELLNEQYFTPGEDGRVFLAYWTDPPSPVPIKSESGLSLVSISSGSIQPTSDLNTETGERNASKSIREEQGSPPTASAGTNTALPVNLPSSMAPKVTEVLHPPKDVNYVEQPSHSQMHKSERSSLFQDELGFGLPTSPDIDPYEDDGIHTYVIDFDKMKKTHIYDWKWADVAVFDYDPEKRKYFVRTIHEPILFGWIGKLYLLFDGESPHKHGHRIREAVVRRIEEESMMRYNLYLDCLNVDMFKNIDKDTMDRIVKKVISTPKIRNNPKFLEMAKSEVNLEYKRSLAAQKFEQVVEKHPKLYKPWVNLPEKKEEEVERSRWEEYAERSGEKSRFSYKVKTVQKLSVTFTKEPFYALKKIHEICHEMENRNLLLLDSGPFNVDHFETIQKENIAEIVHELKTEWLNSIVDILKTELGKIPRSWYNIHERNYDIFAMSKLYNYLTLVRLIMEDTLRAIVNNSIFGLVKQLKTLTKKVNLTELQISDGWEEDLTLEIHAGPENVKPIFIADLVIDTGGPKFLEPLSRFHQISSSLFSHTIQSMSEMPRLLPLIMPQLLTGDVPFLNSVSENEKEIRALKNKLGKYMKRGAAPAECFGRRFYKYEDIWELDTEDYVSDFMSKDPTAEKVKEEATSQMEHYLELEKEIPSVMNITCFQVNCSHAKNWILRKKKNLYTSILDSYAEKLKKDINLIRDEYVEIERKLTTRSEDIEEVMQLKEYLTTVASKVAVLDKKTTACMKNYEIFDDFLYAVSNEETATRWQVAIYASKLRRMMKEAVKWFDDDFDALLKVQQQDLAFLSDQVDSATLTIAGMVAFTELEKAGEVAEKVKKIYRTVRELQEQSALLSKRQRIFNLPAIGNEALMRLIKDIEPFKNLWFTAADWNKIQEAVFVKTLDKVDLNNLNRTLKDGRKIIRRCIKYFKGADSILHVAETIKHQMDEFKPLVPIIQALKNTSMRQRHWEAVSNECGFTVVAKGSLSFRKLLDQGIASHGEKIAEISELANSEYEIESSLDKMSHDLRKHKIIITQDPITEIQIVVLARTTLLIISKFLDATEELFKNPFKGPFEERLNFWYNKVKLAKENMELWFENQVNWLSIQSTFKSPSAQEDYEEEYFYFEKAKRTWRRLLRMARETPEVAEVCYDPALKITLELFKELMEKLSHLASKTKPSKSFYHQTEIPEEEEAPKTRAKKPSQVEEEDDFAPLVEEDDEDEDESPEDDSDEEVDKKTHKRSKHSSSDPAASTTDTDVPKSSEPISDE